MQLEQRLLRVFFVRGAKDRALYKPTFCPTYLQSIDRRWTSRYEAIEASDIHDKGRITIASAIRFGGHPAARPIDSSNIKSNSE